MRPLAAFIVLAPLVPSTSHAAETLHTIELRNRPAEQVLPLVRPLLAPGDAASGSGFLLFVRTEPSRLKEIERVIAAIDVARRMLTVSVRQAVARRESDGEHGVSGRIGIGRDAEVRVPRSGDAGGAEVGNGSITYRARRRDAGSDRETIQTLRVQEASLAYVRVGQSIPHVYRILALTGRGPVVGEGVVYQDATTGFEVVARLQGRTAQLDITPRLTTSRDAAGVVSFQELRTTVNVALGEWIDLGEILGGASEVHREILASGRSRQDERRTVLLKVE